MGGVGGGLMNGSLRSSLNLFNSPAGDSLDINHHFFILGFRNLTQTMQFWMTLAVPLLMVGACLVNGQEAVSKDTCEACEITCKLFSQYCQNGKRFIIF